MASPLVQTLSVAGKVHKKASQPAAWMLDARCASECLNASSSCVRKVSNIHCILRVHSKECRCTVFEPYIFKLRLASFFKLYCAHHDVGAPFFAAAMTRSSSAPRKTAVHASVRMEIAKSSLLSHGLEFTQASCLAGYPLPSCDDVLQLAVIFLLGHCGRRSWIVGALRVLFGPRALSKQRGQLTTVNFRSCRCLVVGARLA